MANTQLDNLTGDVTLFQSALEGAEIALSDQLTPSLREFVQFGTNAVGKLSEAFQEGGLTGAMDALGTILSDGLAMVISKLPTFIDAGMQLLSAIESGIIDNIPVILEAALQIVASLANGIAESLPELILTIIDVVLEIVDTLIDNVDMLIDAALAITLALADGLIEVLPRLLEKAPEIIKKVVAALIENVPKLRAASLELIITLAAGLIEAIPELIVEIPKIIAAIVGGLLDGLNALEDVGMQLIAGLWSGISEKFRWLKGKVTDLMGGLVDSVKDLLGIHSPSTEFENLGYYMMMGINNGISDNAPTILSEVQTLLDTIKASADTFVIELGAIFRTGFENVRGILSGKLGEMQNVWNTWKSKFLSGLDAFQAAFSAMWTAFWKSMSVYYVYNWNNILDSLQKGINNAVSALNRLVEEANKLAALTGVHYRPVSRISVQKVQVPALAQGAVIPPNREFLAVLGDQKSGTNIEAPLDTIVQALRQAMSDSGGAYMNRPIHITLELDRREFAHVVYQANKSEQQRVGVSLAGCGGSW